MTRQQYKLCVLSINQTPYAFYVIEVDCPNGMDPQSSVMYEGVWRAAQHLGFVVEAICLLSTQVWVQTSHLNRTAEADRVFSANPRVVQSPYTNMDALNNHLNVAARRFAAGAPLAGF